MTTKDPEFIKQIICSNFDKSVESYELFEKKYGFFDNLTYELATVCGIRKGMCVCDIGCGTGASTLALAKLVGKEGKVIGIDFSEMMLGVAEDKSSDVPNTEFVLCDAEKLEEHINFKVDVILYNASIFLIPDLDRTLHAAFEVLDSGGIVGMNYLIGMFGEIDGGNLFMSANEDGLEFAPYGRKIVDLRTLPETLGEVGFGDIRGGDSSIEMTRDEVKDFYSIPAQSAGLYPKTPYEERLKLLDALLDHIRDNGFSTLYQVWGWHTAKK